jgi:hypothetical protein
VGHGRRRGGLTGARPVPPHLTDDPLAVRTSWDPLARGGTNFKTRDLVAVGTDRVEFPATWGMRIFAAVFAGLGLVVIAVGIGVSEEAGVGTTLAIFGFGVVFTAIAIAVWRSGTAPIVFDRKEGAFWRGRAPPAGAGPDAVRTDCAPLTDIRALQIIEERLSAKGGSFRSYELNLVLCDARRVNVLDHGDYAALRRDADTIAAFLDCPVWDAIADPEA